MTTETQVATRQPDDERHACDAMTSAEVCTFASCTYRQLDYWVRSGRVPGQKPTACARPCRFDHAHVWATPGWVREFTRAQAEYVRLLVALARAGVGVDVAAGLAAEAQRTGKAVHGIGADGIAIAIPDQLMPTMAPLQAVS